MIINATDLGTLVISQPSSELPPIRISLNVAVGGSLPAGGTVHQILRKSSSAPYDVEWSNDQDAQWGQVTGTITAQGDLMALLAAKQSVSGMSNYLTLSQALAGYYPLNNPNGYITASAIDDFLTTTEASAIYQTQANMVSYITEAEAAVKLEPYFYPRNSNPSGFITSAALPDLTPYLTSADAAASYYPLTNPSSFIPEASASAFTFGRKNGQWETVLPLAGGAIDPNAVITFSDTNNGTDIEIGGWGLGMEKTSDTSKQSTVEFNAFTIRDGVSYVQVTPSGVRFNDGTIQTTSATSFDPAGYATESFVTSQGYITSASLPDLTGYATESFVTSQGYIGFDSYNRITFANGTNPDPVGLAGRFWYQSEKLRFSSTTTQINTIASEGWVTSQGYLTATALTPYITSANASATYQTISGMASFAPLNSPVFTGDARAVTPSLADNDTSIATTAFVKGQSYLTSAVLSGYAQLSGASFTGKVSCTVIGGVAGLNMGIGGIDTASTTAGDLWVSAGSSYLNYRDSGGVWRYCLANNLPNSIDINTATNPALRITQRGTANALVVEDSTSPDSTSFVIDQFGKVGIGVAPDATAAIKIDGNGMSFNGLTVNPTSVANPPIVSGNMSHGEYLKELLITINGVQYAIPLRVV